MTPPSKRARQALEAKAKGLPTGPGIYQFKSERGTVLYVGKAQNLRARVRQYLGGGDGRMQIPALMERVADVDVLATANVKEALLLENELIKRHKPVFNVKLRDDKQYLALRLDRAEQWPRISSVRRFRKDGADYFGPYTSSVALKESLSNLRRLFPLRSCSESTFKDYARRGRPCIEYEMDRCLGPCCGLTNPEAYAEQVQGTLLFLRGRSDELVEGLRQKMQEASREERFEEAARLRNRIEAVADTLQQQEIVTDQKLERDVFGLVRQGGEVEIQVLHVREGRVVAADDYSFSRVQLDDGEVMCSFLGQYYGDKESRSTPREIINSAAFDDGGALEAWLGERSPQPVSIRTPQRGSARRLVEIATRNAQIGLEQRLAAQESVEAAMEQVREACGLSRLPERIECYDVSNLQGSLAVASRVVFEAGQPLKSGYRKYRIREAEAGDDYGCLGEVLRRRLARVESEPLPDLVMVDGGRGQLGVLSAALEDAGLVVDSLGISKERDTDSPSPRVKRSGGLKAEKLFKPGRANPILLPRSSRGLLLLQRIRDESHRFAIEYQRDLRAKFSLTSILEELPGIGAVKRRALLRELGSLRAVREASEENLARVSGISARDAATIRSFFAEGGEPAPAGPDAGE
ncbi:MAG: excinuclease ABC subunit UvrC [Myxococcota bacterium]|nr:excinuclease ABC subunit UvrC [Myxococcota bacterium]